MKKLSTIQGDTSRYIVLGKTEIGNEVALTFTSAKPSGKNLFALTARLRVTKLNGDSTLPKKYLVALQGMSSEDVVNRQKYMSQKIILGLRLTNLARLSRPVKADPKGNIDVHAENSKKEARGVVASSLNTLVGNTLKTAVTLLQGGTQNIRTEELAGLMEMRVQELLMETRCKLTYQSGELLTRDEVSADNDPQVLAEKQLKSIASSDGKVTNPDIANHTFSTVTFERLMTKFKGL